MPHFQRQCVRISSVLFYPMGHCGCGLNFPNHHMIAVFSCEQKQPELHLPLALCQVRHPPSTWTAIPAAQKKALHPTLQPSLAGLGLGLFPKVGLWQHLQLQQGSVLQETNPPLQPFGNLGSCHFPKHVSYSVKSPGYRPHCTSLEKGRDHPAHNF